MSPGIGGAACQNAIGSDFAGERWTAKMFWIRSHALLKKVLCLNCRNVESGNCDDIPYLDMAGTVTSAGART